EIVATSVGVKALNVHPRKSVKRGMGERDLSVTFGGVGIHPGDWLYADEDGIVIADRELV
ncbi:MAG TPA: putative 4-hydroxy-4-methyl-2-oxoglutarate aldolase, partial [Gammaproteobacteria bacterium]|nr:putative 4-hydroxy-4-methyl-2-oxoglutarate aldolase [Gammaproteobacteria bacterium]